MAQPDAVELRRGAAWVGLDNYRTILADPYFWRALGNTLLVVNVVVYVELALALGDRRAVRARRAGRGA